MYSEQIQAVLARLRSPVGRSSRLIYPYRTSKPRYNLSVTLQVSTDEPIIAPGDGRISRIWVENAGFYTENTAILTGHVTSVLIDHGKSVYTKISGLVSVFVKVGEHVLCGATLGLPKSTELGFSVTLNGFAVDPLTVNQNIKLQDATLAPVQAGNVRFGPSVGARDLSLDVPTILVNGVRYFEKDTSELLNINFGFPFDGTTDVKTGPAIYGSIGDYWNPGGEAIVYTDTTVNCGYTHGYADGVGTVHSAQPWLPLYKADGTPSVVCLERVAPLTDNAGTVPSAFDDMLKTYVGGDGIVNAYNLRNVPEGTYLLIVYGYTTATATTSVYAAANGDPPTLKLIHHNGIVSIWSTGTGPGNFVQFPLTVNNSGKVSLSVEGFLSGIQLRRTSVLSF